MKSSKLTGNEFYSTFDDVKADALVAKLDNMDMEAESIVVLDLEEKIILFEIMRAAQNLQFPGTTIAYEEFDREFVKGKVSWGNNVFKIGEDRVEEK